jgi:hypothetical protein
VQAESLVTSSNGMSDPAPLGGDEPRLVLDLSDTARAAFGDAYADQ